ncbi:MAG: chemotaxis protein CheA [Oligoflexales bacterium]
MSHDDLLRELKQTFLDELSDLLESMEEAFMRLEKNQDDKDCVNELFRLFHNAKGSGKTVGLTDLSQCAHAAENILSQIRADEMKITPDIIDGLIHTVDHLRNYQQQARNNVEADTHHLTTHTQKLEYLLHNPQVEGSEDTEHSTTSSERSHDVKQSSGDDYRQEESSDSEPPPPYLEQPSAMIQPTTVTADELIKIPLRKIDELLNLFGEQVILQSSLDHILEGDISDQEEFVRKTALSLKKITQDLQYTMVSLRMVTIKPLFNRMERTVRDISKMTGKEIDFIKKGETAELDKTIADALIDPLTHMIRNAVDHGIESAEDRVEKGKDPIGKVSLTAQRNGGSFEIIVEDDGGGLNREGILRKAQKLGIIKGSGEELSDEKVFSFIFASGFSTREEATEISGRGVGMDVVNQKIIALKGHCKIFSKKDKGTCFIIRLPLSLAMFNGTIISISGEKYVVPNSDFNEAISINEDCYQKDENIIRLQDRILKVIDLKDILVTKRMDVTPKKEKKRNKAEVIDVEEIKTKKKKSTKKLALITRYEQNEYALFVNEILSQEQIVLKQLGPEFRQVKSSSGGTILGDGKVALVLDLNSVVKNNYK